MLATVAAADSARTVRKKYSVSIYNEAAPHSRCAIYTDVYIVCSTVLVRRNLARTDPVCLLERQFTENLLFGQAKFFYEVFSILTFWGINQIIFLDKAEV